MMAKEKELDLSIIHAIALWMPCIIILFSYSTIWVYVWSHSKYLKQVGNIDIKKVIAKVVYMTSSLLHMAVDCYHVIYLKLTNNLQLLKVPFCQKILMFLS